jgi:hypothetical protein
LTPTPRPTNTPVPTTPSVDLARNHPTSDVSSTAGGSWPAYAVDGNPATYWTSGGGGTQWLAVDLGAARTVARVEVDWGPAHATSWWIEYSNDLQSWTRVWPSSGGASGDRTVAVSFTGRHVAVVADAGVDPARYQLAGLSVYGP